MDRTMTGQLVEQCKSDPNVHNFSAESIFCKTNKMYWLIKINCFTNNIDAQILVQTLIISVKYFMHHEQ